jgi:hypothetical protein
VLFGRYLADESNDVRALARQWLAQPSADPAHSGSIFLGIDRNTRSAWLRRFRGRIVSHHVAFADHDAPSREVLSLLAPDSEIRQRARYAPMPLDSRSRPGLARLAWRTAIARRARHDISCCAGLSSAAHLDVARVVARIMPCVWRTTAQRITLLLVSCARRRAARDCARNLRRSTRWTGWSRSSKTTRRATTRCCWRASSSCF